MIFAEIIALMKALYLREQSELQGVTFWNYCSTENKFC